MLHVISGQAFSPRGINTKMKINKKNGQEEFMQELR